MQTPTLLLGRGAAVPAITKANGSVYTDDSVAFDASGKSNRYAPAGADGECIFTGLFVTTTHFDTNVSLFITPYVDGVALAEQRIDLVGVPASDGEVTVHELALSKAHLVAAVERLRYSPRGTWFHLEAKTKNGTVALAAEIVNEIAVEYEVVRESKETP